MAFALLAIEGILGLIMLVCLVMVVVKMFQTGDSTMGIICLVLLIVCGTGVLLTFVMGWIRAPQYGTRKIMYLWTGCILGEVIVRLIGMAVS
jgi:hypothetical protein